MAAWYHKSVLVALGAAIFWTLAGDRIPSVGIDVPGSGVDVSIDLPGDVRAAFSIGVDAGPPGEPSPTSLPARCGLPIGPGSDR